MDKEAPPDPREMRKALRRVARGDSRDFAVGATILPQYTMHFIARNALVAAERLGWSGEDEMTALAYLAAQRIADLERQLYDLYAINMRPQIVLASDLGIVTPIKSAA